MYLSVKTYSPTLGRYRRHIIWHCCKKKKKLCGESPASLRSLVIALACSPDLTVRTGATHLENLNVCIHIPKWQYLDPEVATSTWQHSLAKGKVVVVTLRDSRFKAAIRVV